MTDEADFLRESGMVTEKSDLTPLAPETQRIVIREARVLLSKVEPNGNWPASENAYLIGNAPNLIAELLLIVTGLQDKCAVDIRRRILLAGGPDD